MSQASSTQRQQHTDNKKNKMRKNMLHLTVHEVDCLGEETVLSQALSCYSVFYSTDQMAKVQKGDGLYVRDPE